LLHQVGISRHFHFAFSGPSNLGGASYNTLWDLNNQTGNCFIDSRGVVVQEPLIRCRDNADRGRIPVLENRSRLVRLQ